ncbi:MAG TPA: phospholipase D-like domain-containing protein [Kofleriaceae bacterium]
MPQLPAELKWAQALGRDFTHGSTVQSFIDGRTALAAIHRAIQTTHGSGDFIYLLAWWLDPDLPLVWSGDEPDPSSTLHEILPEKAKAGVQIRAMLWPNPSKLFAPHDSPGELAAIVRQGIDPEEYYARILNDLPADPTQNRSAEIADLPRSHKRIVEWINSLPGAAAIDDGLTPRRSGCHHQKVLCVRGSEGLYALCGGVDLNPDRVAVVRHGRGEPLHDVHCEVRGPAAVDLVQVFLQRWDSHPSGAHYDQTVGPVLGRTIAHGPDVPGAPGQIVRVATTFNRVSPEDLKKLDRRACKVERGIRDGLLGAIASARGFIYFEDQYMTSLTVAEALGRAAKNLKYVLALITGSAISDLPQVWRRRKEFIACARSKGLGDKLHVYYLVDPVRPPDAQENTYIHAKTWVFDDELAYVGSANVNNRGLSSDSEVGLFICDRTTSVCPPHGFAKDLRIRLWARHLGMEVLDGCTGIDAWQSPPPSQTSASYRVRPYDPDGGKDHPILDAIPWSIVDPDLEDLPECESGVDRARRLLHKAVES